MSSGALHQLFLSENGTVYSVGLNVHGELGLGDNINRNSLTQIPLKIPISKTAAGAYFSLMLTPNGSILAFGYNNYGQLGQNTSKILSINKPTIIQQPLAQNITQISAGAFHCVCLNSDREVILWGYNMVIFFIKLKVWTIRSNFIF